MHFKTIVLFCEILAVTSALGNAFVEESGYSDHADNGNVRDGAKECEDLETIKKLEYLLARMEQFEAREKSYVRDMQNLRRQLLIQTRRTASLEGVVRRLTSKCPDDFNPIMNETDSGNILDDKNGRIKSATVQSREEVQTQRIRRTMNENPVAFFAGLSQHLPHMGAHQPITFDNVITNIGNAYNSHLGSFIAPVSGTYVFSTTLFSIYKESYHAQFTKNGHAISTIYLSASEISGYDTASQTIILELQKGDDVTVQNTDADKTVHGLNHSIFSGFLLQEDISSSVIVGK
ncbi:uncharacterized protein LOC128548847 [Mercenaria mercenaria]|uniref:uncharacterized protein LOC128548847 n=1 Tax=Mercenaria mercenaria TaxID=6596 RepID=UPI00234EEC07|nr:uncharacterized protein LOC128548847 [Mercenaria mercenaria]